MSVTATLSRKITLKIASNEYEISYPNSGQQMDIEVLKYNITSDKYDVLKFSMDARSQKKALWAEVIATFNILIPKLKEDLTVTSMLKLEEDQENLLIKVYQEQFIPWYKQWEELLNKPKAQEEGGN